MSNLFIIVFPTIAKNNAWNIGHLQENVEWGHKDSASPKEKILFMSCD